MHAGNWQVIAWRVSRISMECLLEAVEKLTYNLAGQIAGQPANGSTVLLDKCAQVLRGLVLLTKRELVISVEHMAVTRCEHDLRRDLHQVRGGGAGCGVIRERCDGLRQYSAPKLRVAAVGVVSMRNAIPRTYVELVDGCIGDGDFRVELQGICLEHGPAGMCDAAPTWW